MLQGQRLGWKPLKTHSGFFTSTESTSLHLATVGGTNTTQAGQGMVSHAYFQTKENRKHGGRLRACAPRRRCSKRFNSDV